MKEKIAEYLRAQIIGEFLKGKSIRNIANTLKCSKTTVAKWINIYKLEKGDDEIKKNNNRIAKNENGGYQRENENENENEKEKIKDEDEIREEATSINLKKKKRIERCTKIPYYIQKYIYNQFANKWTGGEDKRSIRNIMAKVNRKFNLKGKEKISRSAIQRFALLEFGKPRKTLKRPLLTGKHLSKRKEFADYIINEKVDYNNIFFTDEKRFLLNFVPNKQTYQIRLTKENQMKLKQGNEEIKKLITVEVEKHPKGVMVAGGVSSAGVGKLNFVVGTMDSCAYKQTLLNYQNDINYLNEKYNKNLIFQQDNAPCHVSKDAQTVLENMKKLKDWPPNSPDFSPIESVWSLIQERIQGMKFQNLEELEKKILHEWNRIPQKYCEKIFNKFIKDMESVHKTGNVSQDESGDSRIVFKKNGEYEDKIENIVYNKEFVKKIIKNKIKFYLKKNKIVTNYLKKLANKKFKTQCSQEINVNFFKKSYESLIKDQKSLKKIYEKNIESLKKETVQDFFEKLNQENKQKLIRIDGANINFDESSEETKDDEKIIENIIENVEKKRIEKGKEEIFNYLKKIMKKKKTQHEQDQ